jgi:hypothetical protein
MATYCAVTDLQKYYSPIDNYDLKMDLPDFEFKSLGSDVFQLDDSGAVVVAYRSGLDLGAMAANVGAIASENDWFYDSALDRFTIKLGTDETPEDDDIRLQRSPQDWADAKTYAIQVGTNQVNQFLDPRFPRPLPTVSDNETGDSYDQSVVEMTALLACVHLIKSSGSEDWVDLQNRVTNEDETGILDYLNAGKIKLSFELTKSDEGSISVVTNDATTTGTLVDAIGNPSVAYEVYLVTIGTGGTLATGTENTTITYSVTDSQGSTGITTEYITGRFQTIGGGMSARFTPGIYVAGDTWSMTVKTAGPDTSMIGTIRTSRL